MNEYQFGVITYIAGRTGNEISVSHAEQFRRPFRVRVDGGGFLSSGQCIRRRRRRRRRTEIAPRTTDRHRRSICLTSYGHRQLSLSLSLCLSARRSFVLRKDHASFWKLGSFACKCVFSI